MQVEKVAIAELISDPNNVRKHNAKNIMAIKGSLAKFGQQKPIVVNARNIVIAGNGTLQAASQLGWTHINIVRSDLDGFDAAAFGIADNRTSELAEWDDEVLNSTLAALNIGFEVDDFNQKPKKDDVDLPDQKYEILITLQNEHEQKQMFDELSERPIQCVIL